GRQLLLGHEPEDAAGADDGGAIVEIAAERRGDAEDEDGRMRELSRLGSEPGQLSGLVVDEAAPLDQVLGRIAGDDLLLEAADGALAFGHLPRAGDGLVGVRRERADR